MSKYDGLNVIQVGNITKKHERSFRKRFCVVFFYVFLIALGILGIVFNKIGILFANNGGLESSSNNFVKDIMEVFAPIKTNKTVKSGKPEIEMPMAYKSVYNDNGSVIFFVNTIELASSGVDGTVCEIISASNYKTIKIKTSGNYILEYVGISLCGVVKNQEVKKGDTLGSVNASLTLSLYLKTEKINISLIDGEIKVA